MKSPKGQDMAERVAHLIRKKEGEGNREGEEKREKRGKGRVRVRGRRVGGRGGGREKNSFRRPLPLPRPRHSSPTVLSFPLDWPSFLNEYLFIRQKWPTWLSPTLFYISDPQAPKMSSQPRKEESYETKVDFFPFFVIKGLLITDTGPNSRPYRRTLLVTLLSLRVIKATRPPTSIKSR